MPSDTIKFAFQAVAPDKKFSGGVLEVYRSKQKIDQHSIGQVVTVFGRQKEKVTVPCLHETISRRHACIVHSKNNKLFLIDLGSTHGTSWNHRRLQPHRPQELNNGDVVKFGQSSRSYKLNLNASKKRTREHVD